MFISLQGEGDEREDGMKVLSFTRDNDHKVGERAISWGLDLRDSSRTSAREKRFMEWNKNRNKGTTSVLPLQIEVVDGPRTSARVRERGGT